MAPPAVAIRVRRDPPGAPGQPTVAPGGRVGHHLHVRRHVSARLELDVVQPAELVLAVAVARGAWSVEETLSVTSGPARTPLEAVEVLAPHGTRLHRVLAQPGPVTVEYRASVDGRDAAASAPGPRATDAPSGAAAPDAARAAAETLDRLTYLRPSRYAEADAVVGLARAELGGVAPADLPRAIGAWVGGHLAYVAGSTRGTDGARGVLLGGQGVCRDYAHACVALARALDVPARLAAVYAPGLAPMDFHAVAELWVDGAGWRVVDATRLAPRSTMVRIATGRDAADTAFLSSYRGDVLLLGIEVVAVVDGDLPVDGPAVDLTLG